MLLSRHDSASFSKTSPFPPGIQNEFEAKLSSLGLVKCQRKISRLNEHTVWFIDRRPVLVEQPLLPCMSRDIKDGHLYLHVHLGVLNRVWMKITSSDKAEWIRAYEGTPHPLLSQHSLSLTINNQPRWLKNNTVAKYQRQELRRTTAGGCR